MCYDFKIINWRVPQVEYFKDLSNTVDRRRSIGEFIGKRLNKLCLNRITLPNQGVHDLLKKMKLTLNQNHSTRNKFNRPGLEGGRAMPQY